MLFGYILCDLNIFLYFYKKILMKLHEKIKSIRENKRFSQDSIAYELGLSQSQYSRRENGESSPRRKLQILRLFPTS